MDAKQMRAWRVANGLSQEAAGRLLGKSTKTITRYEGGTTIPEEVAAATLRISNLETVEEDPVIIPATHPKLYDRQMGGRHYARNRFHPGYGKGAKYEARVSELATYVPPEPEPPGIGTRMQAMVDEEEGRGPVWARGKEATPAPEPLPPEWSNLPEAPDGLFDGGYEEDDQ